MNFKISLLSFLLLLAFSLVAFAFSLIGVAGTIIDSIWKVIALCLGVALISGFAYPFIRGVRKGDLLTTNTVFYDNKHANSVMNIFLGPTAVAMQNGKIGEKILVNFQGRNAEGIIISYASTFSPAVVRVTEMERPATHSF